MTSTDRVIALLRDRVPLTLLVDIAGLGPTSQELLREERYGDDAIRTAAELPERLATFVPQARAAWTA